MAHLLTDEAFALSIAHFRADRAGGRARLLDRRGGLDIHPLEPGDPGRSDHRGADPGTDPARARHRLPGRDGRPGRGPDDRAAGAGGGAGRGVHRRRRQPAGRARPRGRSPAAWPVRCSDWSSRGPAASWHPPSGRAESAERYSMPGSHRSHGAHDDGRPGERRRTRRSHPTARKACRERRARRAGRPDGSRDLPVACRSALLAPGIERLPAIALDYLQLVGPAVLAALAAVNVMVVVDRRTASPAVPRRHRVGRRRPSAGAVTRAGAATCSSGWSPASRWWPSPAPPGSPRSRL